MPIPSVRRRRASSPPPRLTCLALGALLAAAVPGCDTRTAEDRGREALEKIQEAIPDVEARALEQQVDSAVVQEAQRQLTTLKEYQGDIDGKLDSVTVNAIQAFQRSAGLRDNGILDARTCNRLKAAAEAKAAKDASGKS
jgi:peptidoglycan hydrolase-like protein with peptidoglycan-binding domain